MHLIEELKGGLKKALEEHASPSDDPQSWIFIRCNVRPESKELSISEKGAISIGMDAIIDQEATFT